jgi:CII-binding regulator of phage lambda lysogenization HflD
MSTSSNDLAPASGYADAIKATVTTFTSINTSESEMLNMVVPDNPIVLSLPSHVQAAKVSANTWNNTIEPLVTANLRNIVGYTNLFNSLYVQLSAYAVALQSDNSNAAVLAGFKSSINQLEVSSKTIYNETINIQSLLSTFQNDTSVIVRNFKTDMLPVQNVMSADQSTIQELQQQLITLSQQLQSAEQQHEVMTSWWMTALTFGISDLVDLIESLKGNISTLQSRIGQIQADENKDSQEVGVLCQVANTLSTLVGLATVLQCATISFISNWQSLSNNLNELSSMEQINPSDPWAESDLAAVNAEWQTIAQEVKNLTTVAL